MKLFIGCDPGLSGAIAVIDEHCQVIDCFDMPVRRIKGVKAATVKNEIDPRVIAERLVPTPMCSYEYAIIERVGTRPGQGIASAFGFGDSFGAARSVIELHCNLGEARPADWKKELGLQNLDKDASMDKARRLIMGSDEFLTRKKDHDRAEAMLLAWMALKRWRDGKAN